MNSIDWNQIGAIAAVCALLPFAYTFFKVPKNITANIRQLSFFWPLSYSDYDGAYLLSDYKDQRDPLNQEVVDDWLVKQREYAPIKEVIDEIKEHLESRQSEVTKFFEALSRSPNLCEINISNPHAKIFENIHVKIPTAKFCILRDGHKNKFLAVEEDACVIDKIAPKSETRLLLGTLVAISKYSSATVIHNEGSAKIFLEPEKFALHPQSEFSKIIVSIRRNIWFWLAMTLTIMTWIDIVMANQNNMPKGKEKPSLTKNK